ncbi:MAG: FMN-binding protein [Dehalococcoidales bacterium]|nr:FMN-binding protein [Dehalococcoidales bacterium]
MHLTPAMLAMYAKAGLYDYCQNYHIDYCSKCGACVSVCPAKIPLLRYVNIAQRELTREAAKNKAPVAVRLEKGAKNGAKIKRFYPIALIITVVAIMLALLTFTGSFTLAEIQSHLDRQTMETIKEIFPEANYYTFDEDTEIYTLYNNGRNDIGYAFYGRSFGYRAYIYVLVGLEDKETIRGIVVTSHYEDWPYWNSLEESNFFEQFTSLKLEDCFSSYSWLPGGVDATTGATVSCRGVVNAVRDTALEKVKYLD